MTDESTTPAGKQTIHNIKNYGTRPPLLQKEGKMLSDNLALGHS